MTRDNIMAAKIAFDPRPAWEEERCWAVVADRRLEGGSEGPLGAVTGAEVEAER